MSIDILRSQNEINVRVGTRKCGLGSVTHARSKLGLAPWITTNVSQYNNCRFEQVVIQFKYIIVSSEDSTSSTMDLQEQQVTVTPKRHTPTRQVESSSMLPRRQSIYGINHANFSQLISSLLTNTSLAEQQAKPRSNLTETRHKYLLPNSTTTEVQISMIFGLATTTSMDLVLIVSASLGLALVLGVCIGAVYHARRTRGR